jgi:FKBP-type peptidyl-prolyl cis-trans isomerase FkpA
MRSMLRVLFFFLAAVELSSCQSADEAPKTGNSLKVTSGGQEFLHHISNIGKRPVAGDYIFFTHTIKINNVIVDIWTPGTFENIVEVPEHITPDINNAWLLEILMQTCEGDSVSFFKKANELQFEIPESINREALLEYHLNITRIADQKVYNKIIEDGFTRYELDKAENRKKIESAEKIIETLFESIENDPKQKERIKSGQELIISMIEHGSGPPIVPGSKVQAHYYGTLQDGKRFDSSFEKGKPVLFVINQKQVIPGIYEGFQKLKKGSSALLVIPPKLAYGENGNKIIPPNSTLYFYVEILDVF